MLTTRVIESIDALQNLSAAWDDLWSRSECRLPNHRCQPLAMFLQSWYPDARLKIPTVWRDDRLLAALPLVVTRRHGVIPIAQRPGNEWFQIPEFLIDRGSDRSAIMRRLLRSTARLDVAWVSHDWIRIQDPAWQEWLALVVSRGDAHDCKSRFEVGLIARPADAESATRGLSKNARRQLRRNLRRLEQAGAVQVVDYRQWGLARSLEQAFEIEHSGWKGREGTSMLSQPTASRFFSEWAQWLDQQGMLMLEFLCVDGRPIAFDFGTVSSGVVASVKVSYDETYRSNGPGQLLMANQMQRWAEGDWYEAEVIDTVGPLTDATGRWTSSAYRIGRIDHSTGSVWGSLGLSGYKTLRSWKSALSGRA